MRSLTLGLLGSLAAAYGVLAQNPAATRSESIRGQVVDARNGAVLRRARVVVSSGDKQINLVFTDDEGRFAIANGAVAPLTVRTSKAGYAPAIVTVPVASAEKELRIALAGSAAVMGRVLDSAGALVSDAYVTGRLLLPAAVSMPAASTRFFTQTDGLGEYRLGSLPAGRYEIMAVRIPPELRRPDMTIQEQLFGVPGSPAVAGGAMTMALAPGDEAHNVDFTIAGSSESCPRPTRLPPDEAGTAAIIGRVTGPSGEPLTCATVRVLIPGPTSSVSASTDRQGRYSIERLPAGSFIVEARKPGYTTLQYGQRRPSDAGLPIPLRDGEERARVDVILPRGSIISGTVVDEHGEPVEGILIRAFQLRRVDGRMTAAASLMTTRPTDDRGQYRLIGLDPGTYLVSAYLVSAAGGGVVSAADAQDARSYAPIYYPATPDISTAQRIALDVGGDARGIDITFAPTFTATVSGSVFDAAGRPFSGTVSLSVSARSGGVSVDSRSAPIDASGRFVMRNVPPGDYVVKARGSRGSEPRFGTQYVTVVDADPPPVTVVVSEGATLEGHLVIEGPPGTGGSWIGVSVAPADFDYSPVPRSGIVDGLPNFAREDGSFRVVGVTGRNRLLITPTPECEACYLKSARVNGLDAADTPFDFGLKGGVYRDVEVVISDAGAAIEGRATDERDAAVAAFSVVVMSAYPDLWYPRSRHLKVARSAADGSFRVTGLPPGDYFVAAVNRFDSVMFGGELNDPEVIEQLSARAQRVTVVERERRTLDLRLIRR